MAIVVICPSCGHRAGAKEEWVGRQVKCPGCGDKITVTASAAATGRPAVPKVSPASPSPGKPLPSGTGPRAKPSPAPPKTAPRRTTPAASRPAVNPPSQEGGVFDLLGDVGISNGDPLGAPLTSAPLGAALGPPPRRAGKKGGSAKTVWIVLGVVFGVMGLGCAGLFLVALVSGIQAAREKAAELRGSTPMPSNLPAWSADPSLSNQLGVDVSFDSYSMRLPNGYTATNLPFSKQPPAGMRLQHWVWADAPAPDGTRRVIMAILAESTTGRHTNDLDGEVRAYVQGARREAVGGQFIPGPTTKGQLMGQPFARVTYTVAAPQVSLHTITYLGFDGERRMLSLVVASKDAEGSEGYKLLEACLLTLKRH